MLAIATNIPVTYDCFCAPGTQIGCEVILMIPFRILIIIKPVFDYRDLKNSSKYGLDLVKVIKSLT